MNPQLTLFDAPEPAPKRKRQPVAKTPGRYILAEAWRHYSYVTRATVARAYRELLGWGVDPLGEVSL